MKFLPSFRKKKQEKPTQSPYAWSVPPGFSAVEQAQEAYQSLKSLEETGKSFDHIEFMDTKRAEIAIKFVRWYLVYVALVIIGVPLFNAFAVGSKEPIDIYKLLAQLGTLLGSPLGFVVGYYFKDDRGNG